MGRFRNECLNARWFVAPAELARQYRRNLESGIEFRADD
jgi:hypothetical protein